MVTASIERSMNRNVRLYLWYALLFHALFWLPIFFLYFTSVLSLTDALRLESIYFLAVVIFEVPSGYFSDALGRRRTMLLACSCLIAAYVLFFFGGSFGVFAIAQVLLAGGIAFNSGTETALLYESLDSVGRADEYADREAAVTRNLFIGSAVAALAGGAIAMIEIRLAYVLSFLSGVAVLLLALFFVEPPGRDTQRLSAGGFLKQLSACVRYWKDPLLRWLFLFMIMMVVLFHIPYEFYQPYLKLLVQGDDPGSGGVELTPLVTGVHTCLTMFIAAWFAARSIWLRDRIGFFGLLVAAAILVLVLIALMSFWLGIIVAVALLLRSCPRAMLTPPVNAVITPRLAQKNRATYLSLQSLTGRLGFSLTLFGLSWVTVAQDTEAQLAWPDLSRMLLISLVVGVVVAVILLLLAPKAVRHWKTDA